MDTGANVLTLKKSFALKLDLQKEVENLQIKTFDGQPVRVENSTRISLDFGRFKISDVKAFIVDELNCDIIIPGKLFSSLEIYRDPFYSEIILNGHAIPFIPWEKNLIRANNDIEVPANSVYCFEYDQKVPSGTSYFVEPILNHLDVKIEPIISKDKIILVFSNCRPFNVILNKNVPLAEIFPTANLNNLEILENVAQEEIRLKKHNEFRRKNFKSDKKTVMVNFGDEISEHAKNEISEILNGHRMAFSASQNDLGLVKGFRYKIDLKPDGKPWYQSPRRISENLRPKLSEIFRSEIASGLIKECSSIYNTPLVLVKKSCGEIRVCLDLREANRNILIEKFPLPDLNSVLNKVSRDISEAKRAGSDQKLFLSRFDLSQAYRQLAVRESDQEKLSFSFDSKQFCNLRMPFGIADAPSTFARLVSIVFRKIDNCYQYLDDMILLSIGEEALKKDVKLFLETCETYGLTLKQKKCEIGMDSINLLGFRLDGTGIGLIPNKVDKILNLKEPTNRDQVKSVTASFIFYREFCPSLIRTLQPLFELLKKNQKFRWGRDQKIAFSEAKNKIANFVKLNHRDPELDLVLVSDASNVRSGAVLYQRRKCGALEPLGFHSKAFSPQEAKMSIRDKELCAIFNAVKNWEFLFIGSPVWIHTDHRSLEFYNSTKHNHLSLRSRNIINYLNRFTIKIIYLPGTDPLMLPSDLLSRAENFGKPEKSENSDQEPVDPEDYRKFSINTLVGRNEPVYTFETYRHAQDSCDEIAKMKKSPVAPYVVKNNILYKNYKDRALIVLPEIFLQEVISYTHQERGHLSGPKLYSYLKLFFTGPKFRLNCLKIGSQCIDCIAVKPKIALRSEPIKIPDLAEKPFDRVYTDIVDFGAPDKEGFRYGLTYCDHLSKFLDLIPLKDKTPKSVCQALVKLFCRFGVPEQTITDNGSEFIASMTQNLFNHFGVYNSRISPLNPGGTGSKGVIELFPN